MTTQSTYTWGVSSNTEVEILRDGKSKKVDVGKIEEGDFLHPGSGSHYWKCDGVERFTSDLPAWELEFSNGSHLVCIEGTVLAGAAGNYLPSSDGNRPAAVLLRQFVDTGEARRRFSVRLLNATKADPKVQKMFKDGRKVYYSLDAAVQFMLKLNALAPALGAFSGFELGSPHLDNDHEFLPLQTEGFPRFRPVMPLFNISATPKPILVATASRHLLGYNSITRVVKCNAVSAVKEREWFRPIFRGFGENESFGANGITVFQPDRFLSQQFYEETFSRATPPFFRIGEVEWRRHKLDLEGCLSLPCDVDTVSTINAKTAADEFLLLAARMRASKVSSDDLLAELNSRARS